MSKRHNQPFFEQIFRKIPETDQGLFMTLNGGSCYSFSSICITDLSANPQTIKEYQPDDIVELVLYGKKVSVTVPWIVMFTFSPLYEAKEFAHQMQVWREDPSIKEMSLDRMSWVIPEGGVDDPEDSRFKIIPFYSSASVSEKGEVRSRYLRRLMAVRPASNGKGNTYLNVSLTNNAGHHDTVGLHRVMAMGFKHLLGNPFKLTVNHDNGKKPENLLSNLEWATYSKNNRHAKDTGLNGNRQAILLRDYWKNTIKRFKSLSDVGLFLGVNSGGLVALVRRGGIYLGRYEMLTPQALASGDRGWNEKYFRDKGLNVDNPILDDTLDLGRKIAVYDVEKETVHLFTDQYGASSHARIEPRDVLNRLMRRERCIKGGIVVCYSDEMETIVQRVKDGSLRVVKDDFSNLGKVFVRIVRNRRGGLREEQRLVMQDLDKLLTLYVGVSERKAAKNALKNDHRWISNALEIYIENEPSGREAC